MKELRRRQDSPSAEVHEQQAMGPTAALSAGDAVCGNNNTAPNVEPGASLPSSAETIGLAQPAVLPPGQNRPTPVQTPLLPATSAPIPPCYGGATSSGAPPVAIMPHGAKTRPPHEAAAERQPELLQLSSRSAVQEVIQAVSQVMQERRGSGKAVDPAAVVGTRVASAINGQARTPCSSSSTSNEQQAGKSVSGAGTHHNAAQQGGKLWLPQSLGNGEPQQDEDGGIWDVPQVRPVGLHYI